ncbi:hypothetical protein C0991_011516, partial [Blastosporella zonata]
DFGTSTLHGREFSPLTSASPAPSSTASPRRTPRRTNSAASVTNMPRITLIKKVKIARPMGAGRANLQDLVDWTADQYKQVK